MKNNLQQNKYKQYIWIGFVAAIISSSATFLGIYAVASRGFNIPPVTILDGAVGVVLAFWLLLGKSRIASILLLLYFLSGKILHYQYYTQRPLAVIVALLFVALLLVGIKGAFLYHRSLD